jgi:hypothetical protein
MAEEAERSHVREVALAAAFRHGHDVVCIPKRLPAAFAQSPGFQKLAARSVVEFAEIAAQGYGIGGALGADAAVAREDLFAEIAGVGAQLPFMDAGLGAKGPAALWYFDAAPSTKSAAGGSAFEFRRRDPAAVLTARGSNEFRFNGL